MDGACYTLVFFPSHAAQMAYGIWYFMSFYIIILLIFVVCYGRILMAIRRQARVMAGHSGPGPSQTLHHTHQMQSRVVKTMILVSVLFVVTWAPAYVISLLKNTHSKVTLRQNGFYAALSFGFLYLCTNPFVYATNFDPVKGVLLRIIPRCSNTQSPESIEIN